MTQYLVKKQFAVNDEIYNVGDIVEMDAVESKTLIEEGKLEAHVESKSISVEVDTKGITNAIAEGLAKFAPKPAEKVQKMGFGEFLQGIAKKTINITTGNQGEYATTDFTDPDIGTDLLRDSGVAQSVNVVSLNGTSNSYKFNVVSSMGTAPAITTESSTIGASQPLVTQFTIALVKATYRYDVTEEALEDTGALVAEVNDAVPSEFSKFIEDGVINGNTAFTGIIGDTNTVAIAKEAGQTDDTIVVANVDKMFCSAKNPNKSVWVMSRSAYCAVQGLEDSEGQRIFQGPNGLGAAPFGTLKGLPVQVSDYCPALGLSGDIILADLSKYKMAVKGGLKVASSKHIKFLEDEEVFRFTYRMGGLPVGIKLTATDGTEIGDFVVIADRGSL